MSVTEKLNFELAIPDHLVPGGVVVRTAGTAENPLFCLADVCAVLEISNHRDVATRLDDDEKYGVGLTGAIGRTQQATFINESGLYTVLLRSEKPQAKPFRKWITKEVIPCIMRHGCYPAPAIKVKREAMSLLAIRDMLDKMIEQEEQIENLVAHQEVIETRVADVEHLANAALDYQQGNHGYYAALAFLKVHGVEVTITEASRLGVRATRICRERGIQVRRMRDPRFGEVNLYPESVLEEAWESLQSVRVSV